MVRQSTGASSDHIRTDTGRRGGLRRRGYLKAAGAAGIAGLTAVSGCLGGGGRGGPTGPVKIGVLAPEPAKNPIGASIANSVKLAADQLNADGGVLGNDVEPVIKDTHEDPATGKQKYQELAVGENVDFTVGIFTSEVLMNVLDSIAQQEKIHITAGAATPKASQQVHDNYQKYKYHFRAGPVNGHHLGVSMVDFAEAKFADMGWESVAVLAEDYLWTQPVTDVLNKQLGDIDVSVEMSKRYASGTKDFSPIYDDIESAGVDGAYVVMAHTGTAAVVQWAKQQRPFGFGGIHVPMQLPSYFKAVKGACRFGFTQTAAAPTSEITEKTVPYADAYNAQFDKYPVYTGYIAFDAVKMYAAAVEAVGSRLPTDVLPELENMTFTGTTGNLRYYGKDETYTHDVVYGRDAAFPIYVQWQGEEGVQETLFPGDIATASYTTPPWA